MIAGRTAWSDTILSSILNELSANRVVYEERGKYFTRMIPEHPYFEPNFEKPFGLCSLDFLHLDMFAPLG